MSQMYTFHKTVRGHLHIMNEIPCEDFSSSYSADNGRYHIAIVADGHGSKACFRSEFGSKAVTEITFECLKQFAESTLASEEIENRFYRDMFSNPRYRQMTLRRLTDTIIARWHDCVLEDYKDNPPSVEEMGEYADMYKNGEKITHIYGTTLMAALMLPSCLVLLHQGDGRCDVFYDDGTVDQPIPWDSRCEDTAVTSMCDDDVAESFRTCVINLLDKPVIACYLGCDGVEDAYRDTYEGLGGSHILMGGVHTFYKDMTCQIASKETEEFEAYLEMMLPEFSADGRFSRSGSGDDVSVAGIVDVDAIKPFVKAYQLDVKRYALEEDLFWKEDELRGKTRKHGILQKRVKEAQASLEEEQSIYRSWESKLQQLMEQRNDLSAEVEQAKVELDVYREESQLATKHFESADENVLLEPLAVFKKIGPQVQRFIEEISSACNVSEAAYKKLCKKLSECDEQINETKNKMSESTEKISALEQNLAKAQEVFSEYDAKYQSIDEERKRIEEEIAALPDED